jgi:hypothetical protein
MARYPELSILGISHDWPAEYQPVTGTVKKIRNPAIHTARKFKTFDGASGEQFILGFEKTPTQA